MQKWILSVVFLCLGCTHTANVVVSGKLQVPDQVEPVAVEVKWEIKG